MNAATTPGRRTVVRYSATDSIDKRTNPARQTHAASPMTVKCLRSKCLRSKCLRSKCGITAARTLSWSYHSVNSREVPQVKDCFGSCRMNPEQRRVCKAGLTPRRSLLVRLPAFTSSLRLHLLHVAVVDTTVVLKRGQVV